MNVAHCIHGLGLGGAQQVIKEIVAGRTPGAFRHLVITPEGGVLQAELERAGAEVRIVPRRLPKFDPFWIPAMAAVLRHERVDVVHTHLFGDSLHGYLAARLARRRPVVMTLHCALEFLTPLQQRGYRWLLDRGVQAVACSESVRRSFAAAPGASRWRLQTIANGITARGGATDPTVVKAALGLPPGAVVVGTVGRLEVEKAYDRLITAFAQADVADARLVIVGEGSLRDSLEAHARTLGVTDRVCFTGFRADVAALLPVFDVFAMTSPSEGLPIALLEAMAVGRCIVAAGSPGVQDVLTNDADGLIVPPNDDARCAAALRRALGDGALRRRLGTAAHARFTSTYSAVRMVAAYEELYRRLREGVPVAREHAPMAGVAVRGG